MTLPERWQALKGANAFGRLRGQQPENGRLNYRQWCSIGGQNRWQVQPNCPMTTPIKL
ncbi:hypothetical protein C4J99_1716 [Pseudomonas synxantha]|nr:hypothetical protein C4J99_1716 [Pseudomonas synxantha]